MENQTVSDALAEYYDAKLTVKDKQRQLMSTIYEAASTVRIDRLSILAAVGYCKLHGIPVDPDLTAEAKQVEI